MNDTTFRIEHSHVVTAAPAALWQLLSDVSTWPRWNAGVEAIAIDGPFQTGTSFRMTVPGQGEIASTLLDVVPEQRFVDETRVGDLVVRVRHDLEALPGGATKVTYTLEAEGPEAAEIGPAIASDFPEVLRALGAATTV